MVLLSTKLDIRFALWLPDHCNVYQAEFTVPSHSDISGNCEADALVRSDTTLKLDSDKEEYIIYVSGYL